MDYQEQINTKKMKNEKTDTNKNQKNYTFEISRKRINNRILLNNILKKVFSLSTVFALLVLGLLFYRIAIDAKGWIDLQFLTSNLSIFAEKAGIKGAIIGTVWLMLIVAPITMSIGVITAIYLEEYAEKNKLSGFLKVNISNLAGVPSVIFGLLGLTIFGRLMNLGSSILAGGLTMSLLVLPIIVVSSQEALKSVPSYMKEASYALGADKWTTIRKVVLPVALPGILTGSILSLSRAIGETAPLVVLGIPTLIMKYPTSALDNFTALPIQIYYWTLDAVLTREYANLAAATIVVLLVILFLMNSIAIVIRNKFQKRY
jgi:phosphate transport system permease protein